jgi:phenylpropionate dioxygenase-like ring-hydroxylating dioxygenase large terminal subunit
MNTRHDWPDSWKTLSNGISSGRYTDPGFSRLEYERLWTRVWQVAARLDEIPAVGDHTVYEILDQSVLVVRTSADCVKAYHNVCPHRGTALAKCAGHFPKERIICPFHGWRWDLEGHNQFVLEREQFKDGKLEDSDVALYDVHCKVFAGFVFISLARDPQPFDEFIAPVRQLLEDLAIEHMHHNWWKALPIAANWKVAQEAFFEGYHVPATHPQLEPASARAIYGDDPNGIGGLDNTHDNILTEALANGHGRFYAGKRTAMQGHVKQVDVDPVDAMASRLNMLVEGMDAMVHRDDIDIVRSLKGKSIPDGSSLGGEYVKALYADAGARKRPMPKPDPATLAMWGGEIFIFPNFMILPQAGNAMMYRVRPDGFDPDRCIFEIYSTRTLPAATKPPRATVQRVNNIEDPKQVLEIPRQDFGNIPRMQKGLHALGIRQTWLAGEHEKMILNMHQELDRYLGAPA